MKKNKLKPMPYANCEVRTESNGDRLSAALYSYGTKVIELTLFFEGYYGKTLVVDCYGLFSQTTRKHISKFLKEFCGVNLYSDVKKAIKENNGTFSVASYEAIQTVVAKICEYEGL